ncbi:MAG: universal stress protein [Bacteroidia bacterium]|nr:universal stress protein [Bacteroidia bacterium]
MIHILLPTDFSEYSWNAIKHAFMCFKDEVCTFHLFHVNRLSHLMLHDASLYMATDTLEDVYERPTKTKLNFLVKKIRKEIGINTKHKILTAFSYDFFINAIRNEIDKKQIDLIVMGTKGASGLKKYTIGSNTGNVIVKVKCTTLVVPEEAKCRTIKQIVFPTDFSTHYSIDTLKPLLQLAYKTNASIRILHSGNSESEMTRTQRINKDLIEDIFAELDISFHFLSDTSIENGLQCFVESRDIDLITMVAKNLNFFQQILFQTKTEKVSYQTKIPFLVLHE